MIRQSESIAALCAALVAAQAKMPGVPKATKGQVGNAVRFYADLSTVLDTVQPVLAEHKLGFAQFPCDSERGAVAVTTRLFHCSGEWMESTVSMPSSGNGAQGVGSALTYCRRYSLMAVLGLAAEDDDGKAASTPPPRQQQPRQTGGNARPATERTDPNAITPTQTRAMQAGFNGAGIRERADRIAFIVRTVGRPVESSQELTKVEAAKVIGAIEAMVATGEVPSPEGAQS